MAVVARALALGVLGLPSAVEAIRFPRPVTKLIEVTIHVRDVERSRSFYELLGVACGPVDVDEPGGARHVHAMWGKWSPGSDDFLMLNVYPADGSASTGASLGFAADDLDALHERLVGSGLEVVHGPETRPWGRMATYRDPDGNLVSVSQRPGGRRPAATSSE